ncbi:MAG: hypothetical protein ACIAQ0_06755 [Phycisphaerales bacterium JB058]
MAIADDYQEDGRRVAPKRSKIGFAHYILLTLISLILLTIAIIVIFSTILSMPRSPSPNSLDTKEIVYAATAIGMILPAAAGMIFFLRTSPRPTHRIYSNIELRLAKQEELMESIEFLLADEESRHNIPSDLSASDKDKIAESIVEAIVTNAKEGAMSFLKDEAATSYIEDTLADTLESNRFDTLTRLEIEIENQNKRGTLNLTIGTVFTLIALAILFWISITLDVSDSSTSEILQSILPRISLAFFIQVFALFFLRMYRNNLNEIKYFQNEMTSVELQHTALTVSSQKNMQSSLADVIERLANSDRNATMLNYNAKLDKDNHLSVNMDGKSISAIATKLIDRIGK